MKAKGGAVAIWHNIAPAGRENFYAWHGSEHMPERVGIPGFIRGRRFIAFDADLEFFNLYETESPDVVKGDDYKARLDSPTPWTLKSVASFQSVARALCGVAATAGDAEGGLVATARYDLPAEEEARHMRVVSSNLIPRLVTSPGIAAAHLLLADRDASGYVNAEQRARGAANVVPAATLIVEGWGDEAAFAAVVRDELSLGRMLTLGVEGPVQLGFYRHQLTTRKAGAA
ncbi:MAG: hypothetical protein BGP06_18790 [Rhizobiales bacterium 65-9]|nr:MAG: hypothetical protein BGP06_18790 [Rhizobiales bacterium 65-9]